MGGQRRVNRTSMSRARGRRGNRALWDFVHRMAVVLTVRYSLSRSRTRENIRWVKQYLSRGFFVADSIRQHLAA
jgi:hypothetical protein